jgi:hypothetical protein
LHDLLLCGALVLLGLCEGVGQPFDLLLALIDLLEDRLLLTCEIGIQLLPSPIDAVDQARDPLRLAAQPLRRTAEQCRERCCGRGRLRQRLAPKQREDRADQQAEQRRRHKDNRQPEQALAACRHAHKRHDQRLSARNDGLRFIQGQLEILAARLHLVPSQLLAHAIQLVLYARPSHGNADDVGDRQFLKSLALLLGLAAGAVERKHGLSQILLGLLLACLCVLQVDPPRFQVLQQLALPHLHHTTIIVRRRA